MGYRTSVLISPVGRSAKEEKVPEPGTGKDRPKVTGTAHSKLKTATEKEAGKGPPTMRLQGGWGSTEERAHCGTQDSLWLGTVTIRYDRVLILGPSAVSCSQTTALSPIHRGLEKHSPGTEAWPEQF